MKNLNIDTVINDIKTMEIPIPVERFFDEFGNHVTKKEYGRILIEILCDQLKEKYG